MIDTATERRWFLWALNRYGRLLGRAVRRVFIAAGRKLFNGLETVGAAGLIAEALRRLEPGVWVPLLRRAVRPVLGLTIRAGAEDERVRHAQGSPVALIRAISKRVRQIRDQMALSIAWLMAFARLRYDVLNALRIGLIAGGVQGAVANARRIFQRPKITNRTDRLGHREGHTGLNRGKDASRREMVPYGYVNAKIWWTRHDNRVRETHEEADNQMVPVYAPFIVGKSQCQYPGDPILPAEEREGCRCVALSRKLSPEEYDKRFKGTVRESNG